MQAEFASAPLPYAHSDYLMSTAAPLGANFLVHNIPYTHLPISQQQQQPLSLSSTDPATSPDLQSLPSLSSPNPSLRDLSDSGRDEDDEDDDMDEYEIFATPGHQRPAMPSRPAPLISTPSGLAQFLSAPTEPFMPSLCVQQPAAPSSPSYLSLFNASPAPLDPEQIFQMHPHLPHAPSTQPLFQHSQPLQSQFLQEPSAFAPAPSMGAHMQNVSQYEAPSSLDCYLESLGQSFGHPSVLSLVDPPSVDNGDASRRLGADLDFSSGASSLVLSPTMSWISATPSRDNSPEPAMNASLYKKHLFRPPVKRRGSSLYSKSGGKMARSKSAVPHHAPMGLSVPTAHHAGATEPSTVSDCALPQPSADRPRKRRARQIKLKAKPTSFVCDSPGCGKVFSRAYNLTSHMKTHSSERPFLCGSCPLAFARRHDRERHVRLHTGEKPYPCESCGCGFMRNDALHRHQRICGQSAAALLALMQQQQQQRGPVEGSSSGATSYQDLFGL